MYDKEKGEYVNLQLYDILWGNSGIFLFSIYIKPIREAFDFVERYFWRNVYWWEQKLLFCVHWEFRSN